MGIQTVDSTQPKHLTFFERVAKLRAKIVKMGISRRKDFSDTEVVDLKGVIEEKVANIIEYTLIDQKIPYSHEIILEGVAEHMSSFPIMKAVSEGKISIEEAEGEFAHFLEGKRVKSPEIRHWIALLVDNVIKRSKE